MMKMYVLLYVQVNNNRSFQSFYTKLIHRR